MENSASWQRELAAAKEAANAAGKILLGRFGHVDHIVKKGDIDLVTEADIQAEKSILDIIGQSFPEDHILSEEKGSHGEDSRRTWLIDPLDGTTNYAHGFPFFATSIALEIDREVVLGIVYNPYTREFFEATKGRGAYLNGHPIEVSTTAALSDALLGTGFPYDFHERPEAVMDRFTRMIIKAQGVRRPGSAAIDLCYVAAGRLDGFWEEGLKPWDTAAGMIIVEEAGGRITTFEGAPYSPYSKSIVAGNPLIHRAMLEILKE